MGWIALGLKLRLERGIAPFTVMSLDNLAGNGRVLRQVVLDYIGVAFPEIKSVVQDQASFPSSMVDRIVPARESGRPSVGAENTLRLERPGRRGD